MKKSICSFLILSSALLFAQKSTGAKLAVADGVIGTVGMFSTHHKNAVESSRTYTSANLPENLKPFSSLAGNGLVAYQLKPGSGTLDRVSLDQLNEQFGLPKGTPVLIDGKEVADTSLQIYGDLLSNMKPVEHNGRKSVSVNTASGK